MKPNVWEAFVSLNNSRKHHLVKMLIEGCISTHLVFVLLHPHHISWIYSLSWKYLSLEESSHTDLEMNIFFSLGLLSFSTFIFPLDFSWELNSSLFNSWNCMTCSYKNQLVPSQFFLEFFCSFIHQYISPW